MSVNKKPPSPAKKVDDQDIVKPLDNHRPIVGPDVPVKPVKPVKAKEKPRTVPGEGPVTTQDNHRPIAEPQ
ncbi:hypothetical protein [Streptomyces sp. NPDC003077]|uniref:hypothetical protein n=1 Tax=Streptomyces sp. NPDC003077 TaxID=3154443 RepID=UPI0033B7FBCA